MEIMDNILFKCIFNDLRYSMNFIIYIVDLYSYWFFFHMYSILQFHFIFGEILMQTMWLKVCNYILGLLVSNKSKFSRQPKAS